MKHLSIKQKRIFTILALVLLVAMLIAPGVLAMEPKGTPEEVRFASFNASLNRFNQGDLAAELSAPGSAQPDVIAEIIQRTRPHVLLINEFDFDAGDVALDGFQDNYLSIAHGDAEPIYYPYRFAAPSNTGIPSGRDLDKNGIIGGPGDAFGFGFFPGQYGMAVYSMFPINYDDIRTFQLFLWKDMPGAMLPIDPTTGESWYDEGDLDVFRLSSKSHWDVPIQINGKTVHFLTSHPTPPVFDGPEDRNGTRNNDEIRFWADYVIPSRSGYIYDDNGNYGGITPGDPFVIAGDQNSDPFDGDSVPGSIQQLLEHPLVNTKITPDSEGGVEQSILQNDNNDFHLGDPAFDTADFAESIFGGPGNLRADYVLPRKQLRIDDAGVFWPLQDDPLFSLVGTFPFPSSEHRLVWVDVFVPSH
jgi:3-phytase/alkaline phosphatase D